MKADSKAGLLIISLGIFGVGWLSAPEARIVHSTDVEIIRVPEVKVVKEVEHVTERIPAEMPAKCEVALGLLDKVRSYDADLTSATGKMSRLVAEAHRLVASDKAREFVPLTEELSTARQDAANASIGKAETLDRFDREMEACRKQLEKQ